MNIVLCAVEPPLATAWEAFCGHIDCVSIHHGSILDVECDAIVSPANSFGFMDGGIDMLYTRHFGDEIETRVRRQILEHHHGELVIGQADIVETGNEAISFLIAAPTMRVPMTLGPMTINPYLAARAALLLALHGTFRGGPYSGERISERVDTIAFPGLGTGVGRVSFPTCAIQMKRAIEDTLLGQYRMPRSWAEASERPPAALHGSPETPTSLTNGRATLRSSLCLWLLLFLTAGAVTAAPLDEDYFHARILNIRLPGEWDEYRAAPYVRAAAALQSLGKDVACRELTAAIRRDSDKRGSFAQRPYHILCRMLFEPKPGKSSRRPLLGGPGFLGGTSEKDWPKEPIEVVGGVPFLIVFGYSLFGKAEPAEEYFKYCLEECDWSSYRYRMLGTQDYRAALAKLLSSPKWQRALESHEVQLLTSQIE